MKYTPHGAALEYLQGLYHGPMRDESVSIPVGVAVVTAADRDPERIIVTFVNLGADAIFLRPNGIPSATAGFRLGASGGALSIATFEDGTLPTAEWSAIGAAAGLTLFRMSVRRESIG
jgi:hypothetical protein